MTSATAIARAVHEGKDVMYHATVFDTLRDLQRRYVDNALSEMRTCERAYETRQGSDLPQAGADELAARDAARLAIAATESSRVEVETIQAAVKSLR